MTRRGVWRVALCAAALCIAALTLTPGGAAPSGAASVFCVTCSETWLADAISNVLLFVPLGLPLVGAGASVRVATLCGVMVSLLIEMLQLAGVPAGRTASAPDLVMNTAGTVIGTWLAMNAHWLLAPSAVQARRLCAAWLVLGAAVFSALTWALTPATPLHTPATVRESPLPFTPGYGWYAALPDDAVVNSVTLPARGTGAVRVAAERTDSVQASVRVRGRDARAGVVPIVYVHDPAMTATTPRSTRAHLLLAQRGDDAWLSSDLWAGRWGLIAPAVVARGAFVAGRDGVVLQASVTSRVWRLSWRDASAPAVQHEASLTLSPLIGWALVQSVVAVGSPWAPVVTVLWVAWWLVPLGYWLTRVRRTG